MKHFVTAVCEGWCVNTLCLLVCVAEFQDNADSHYFWHFKSCSIVQRLRLFVSQDFPRWSWMCSSSCRSTCSEVITSDPSSLKGQTGSNLKPFNKLCFSDQPTLFCLHHSITENIERQTVECVLIRYDFIKALIWFVVAWYHPQPPLIVQRRT